MLCGTLLHRFRTVDEFDLHGRGRGRGDADRRRAVRRGGLLLAGLPPFALFHGMTEIEGAASAARLRLDRAAVRHRRRDDRWCAAARGGPGFHRLGSVAGCPDPAQARAAEERVDETRDERDHTPPLMVIVPGDPAPARHWARPSCPVPLDWAARAAAVFVDRPAYSAWLVPGAHVALPAAPHEHVSVWPRSCSALSALPLAVAHGCARTVRPAAARGAAGARPRSAHERSCAAVRGLHSGHIGDYIAWWTAGAASFGAVCLLALR